MRGANIGGFPFARKAGASAPWNALGVIELARLAAQFRSGEYQPMVCLHTLPPATR